MDILKVQLSDANKKPNNILKSLSFNSVTPLPLIFGSDKPQEITIYHYGKIKYREKGRGLVYYNQPTKYCEYILASIIPKDDTLFSLIREYNPETEVVLSINLGQKLLSGIVDKNDPEARYIVISYL